MDPQVQRMLKDPTSTCWIVQAWAYGLGWVDCSKPQSLIDATDIGEHLFNDDTAWIKQGGSFVRRRVRVVPDSLSRLDSMTLNESAADYQKRVGRNVVRFWDGTPSKVEPVSTS